VDHLVLLLPLFAMSLLLDHHNNARLTLEKDFFATSHELTALQHPSGYRHLAPDQATCPSLMLSALLLVMNTRSVIVLIGNFRGNTMVSSKVTQLTELTSQR
jgi:hypothetical protein